MTSVFFVTRLRIALLAVASSVCLLSGAVRAAEPGCAQPRLGAGQEAAIERLVTPATLPPGVTTGDTRVLADRIVTTLQAADGTRFVYVLSRPDPAPAAALRSERFRVQMALPCLRHGAVADLAGLQPGATPEEPCTAPTATLDALDAALLAAVRAGESAVVWRCPEQGLVPGDAAAHLGAALREVDARLQVADHAAARQLLEAALRQHPPASLPLAARADLGLALWRLGRKDEATRELRAVLQAFQGEPTYGEPGPGSRAQLDVLARLAAAQALLGDTAAGQGLMATCRQREAGHERCDPLPLADALELAGQGAEAAALLDAELGRTKPPAPELLRARIGLASRQDDAVAEVRTAEAAVTAYPDDLAMQDALATALFRAEQHERAIRTFQGIFRKDPTWPNVLGRLSGVFNDMGRLDQGPVGDAPSAWQTLHAEMQARAARDPDDTVAQFLHGVSLFYNGKFEPALQQMRRVEAKAPREGRVFIYQAMAHLWLGRRAEAERLVQRALEVNPHDPDVYYCHSQIVRSHDLPAAIRSLERYLALSDAPGALHFEKKDKRVAEELAMLRRGEMPPLWDRPGHFDDGARQEEQRVPAWLAVVPGAALLAAGWWLWRRRKA